VEDPFVLGQHLGDVLVVEVLVDVFMDGDDDRCTGVRQNVADPAAPVPVARGLQAAFLPPPPDSLAGRQLTSMIFAASFKVSF